MGKMCFCLEMFELVTKIDCVSSCLLKFIGLDHRGLLLTFSKVHLDIFASCSVCKYCLFKKIWLTIMVVQLTLKLAQVSGSWANFNFEKLISSYVGLMNLSI